MGGFGWREVRDRVGEDQGEGGLGRRRIRAVVVGQSGTVEEGPGGGRCGEGGSGQSAVL